MRRKSISVLYTRVYVMSIWIIAHGSWRSHNYILPSYIISFRFIGSIIDWKPSDFTSNSSLNLFSVLYTLAVMGVNTQLNSTQLITLEMDLGDVLLHGGWFIIRSDHIISLSDFISKLWVSINSTKEKKSEIFNSLFE